MELDWYSEKLSASAVLTPTSSFRWGSFGDVEGRGSARWSSLLNLVQDSKLLRGYSSADDYSPPGSNASSPKKRRDSLNGRSLAGDVQLPLSTLSPSSSSLSPSSSTLSPSKSHCRVCYGCVLHSHDETHDDE